MSHLDSIIGGIDPHSDGKIIVMGGGTERLAGGRAKWHLRDKMMRLQHIVDTSNTREIDLLRVVGKQISHQTKRVTFSRKTFDDSKPDVQPTIDPDEQRMAIHSKVMKTLRNLLARDEKCVIMDAAHEYNLMEPLILAMGEIIAVLSPTVAKYAHKTRVTKGGRIKVGPKMAPVVEQLSNPHISRAHRDEGAEIFSYDVVEAGANGDMASFIDFLLGLLPPTFEGKWEEPTSLQPPVWPLDVLEIKIDGPSLDERREEIEKDAAEHEPLVAERKECPCLISRRFALAVLEIEQALEPYITAIENYYIDAARYVIALHNPLQTWLRSAVHKKR